MTAAPARRRADRREWQRILARRFTVAHPETPAFTGAVTLLLLDRFGELFYSLVDDQPCCVAATGYSWLQHFPTGARHTVTTMFDPVGNIVQWYIDICRQHGMDAEELEDAVHQGLVSPADYALAWREARRLLAAIERGALPLLALSVSHRTFLLQELPVSAS
jgi:predicted RNA-binding protein associated with RNAse of E/G family